jgi:2,3-diaminopropionate biosynthesis protein SbnA
LTVTHEEPLALDAGYLELPGFTAGLSTSVKLEGLNAAGSIKLKTAREMVAQAEADGLLVPGATLIESTSGNLGIALAAICARRGYKLILVTDPNTTAGALIRMRALGADVVTVSEKDANGGYLQTRIDHITDRLARDPGLLWLNQYTNPANIEAHRKHTAAEIMAGFGPPDWLFVGVGTGGTLMGCARGLREAGAGTAVVAVDVAGSVTFGGPPGRRWIPGLGSSRPQELIVDDGTFRKAVVGEADAVRQCRRVARGYGVLLGGSSGAALAAVIACRDQVPEGSRVLVISPDMGDNYLDTVYDDDWVLRRFGRHALDAGPGYERRS